MTKEQREALAHLKHEVSSPKHDLLNILRQVENLSPAQASKLDWIIGLLENWQNR